jgi:histidinol-phosphate aminotransferase
MQRRDFLGTGLALGAGAGLLGATGCAPATRPVSGITPRPNDGPIRLNANENPLGLSPAARRALLEDLGEANRYPRQARTDLIAALAAKHAVAPEQIQLGCGSTEILQMAVQSTSPDAVVVLADPTFEDVSRFAATSGRRVAAVPLREDGAHDVARMREAAGSGPALVFICNPNNPTGTITPCDEINAWIADAGERVTFLIDEAYFEFVEDARYQSALPLVASRPGLIVSRTFSKIFGMAGLRLGYAVAQPQTSAMLRGWAVGNNGNELALVAGRAALGDADFQSRTLTSNRAAKAIVTAVLDDLGLARLPSHTNFLMHRIPGDVPAHNARMREEGLLVGRPFPPMLGWSRVSIGLPAEMERFADTLRIFRSRGWV